MTPISICIIAKNEEKNMDAFLSRIIKHTAGYPIEILIADTGSTDRTIDIIQKYPVHLLHFTWVHDFSAARNFTLEQASNDWVLVLDCDEYIEALDMNALMQFTIRHSDSVGLLERLNHFPSDGRDAVATDYVERFFNRKYYHYEAIIHEQVRSIDGSPLKRVTIPLTVDHNGYAGTAEELLAKAERNNTLLLKMLEQEPNNPYIYFQLGQGAYMLHDYESACNYFEKGLEFHLNPEQIYVQMMVEAYGYSLVALERYEDALLLENIYDEFATGADFVFLMGYIYLRTGNYLKAMAEFLKATTFSTARVEGANSFIPTYNMGVINECLGNKDVAISLYEKCGAFPPALARLKELLPA